MNERDRIPAPAPVGSQAIAMTPIRSARENQGKTQAEIATLAGIDPAHFQMIEERSDVAAPNLTELQAIADALHLRVEDVM